MLTKHRYPTEKNHRLPREYYLGETTAAFTLCVHDKKTIFQDPAVVHAFVSILITALENSRCIVPVYCFMPDHLHIILTGAEPQADLWKTIVSFKQKTGYWLSRNMPTARWQKDFYDHIISYGKNRNHTGQIYFGQSCPKGDRHFLAGLSLQRIYWLFLG